jgi:hypothetical protein
VQGNRNAPSQKDHGQALGRSMILFSVRQAAATLLTRPLTEVRSRFG